MFNLGEWYQQACVNRQSGGWIDVEALTISDTLDVVDIDEKFNEEHHFENIIG
jgi:hypothetical protein